jgi:hypothetical protein
MRRDCHGRTRGLLLVAAAPDTLVADDDAVAQREEQIVQPPGLGDLLDEDGNGAAHAAKNAASQGLGRHHASGDHAAAALPHEAGAGAR